MSVAAAACALATVAEVKYAWGRPQTDTGYDDRIQTLINMVSGRIADLCGRIFQSATYTAEKYDGDGGFDLFLRQYPVTTLTSISIDGVAVDLTDTDTVSIYYDEGRVYYTSGWNKDHKNISVTYTAGYSAADIPQGLRMACVEWVILLLEHKSKDAKADAATAFPMPKDLIDNLSPYRRMG